LTGKPGKIPYEEKKEGQAMGVLRKDTTKLQAAAKCLGTGTVRSGKNLTSKKRKRPLITFKITADLLYATRFVTRDCPVNILKAKSFIDEAELINRSIPNNLKLQQRHGKII